MTVKPYPEIDANPNFPKLEEEILQFWKTRGAFGKSVAQRPAALADKNNAYVFYDGPPFANGLPHYGHLLTGYVKDAIARYHTMKGRRVERRFGWDCHGLPAEMGAEKELGISGRAAIINYGIDKFNAHCRTSVMKYTQEWEYYVSRQGRWVDFKNDYKTMDKGFMESCIWAFSELYKNGLVYESMRVMPYSWAAETPVSNFETRIDNATRAREDMSAYVKFRLTDESAQKLRAAGAPEAEHYYLVAWTTTPWTLPSNLALAVNDKQSYFFATGKDNKCYIFGNSAYAKLKDSLGLPELAHWMNRDQAEAEKQREEIQKTKPQKMEGLTLIGLTYEPLFPYFKDTPKAFRVLDGSEFVTDGDGTGIVHMAPGFGEVDQKCCNDNGIETLVPVDEKGRFTTEIFDIPWEFENNRSPLVGEHASQWASGGGNEIQLKNARQMRKEPTPQEAALWQRLKGEQLDGYKFRRQELIGDYIVDFVNYEAGIIVEADGGQHADDTGYEAKRSSFLESQGFKILRFWNHEITENIEGVMQAIRAGLSPHGSLRSPAPPQGGSEVLSLQGLNVVPDTRIAETDITVAEEDKAQHIAAKDVAKYGLANMRIVRWLKANHKLVKNEPFKHNYPHCWRTDTPLIYRAMSSWYVNVQKIKDRMIANNQTIHWIPDHVKNGQMGKGIESAPDWSISRNRFWGTPIPIWISPSGKIIVPGSIEEIEKLSGQKVVDLHRPYIDEIIINKDGEEYRRIEDVFDCWFESGSMPFAQLHYPFENKERFECEFPADFITEYIAQTRGWFYTLQVLSAALFQCAPFKNVICHGVVIDEETGLKYSKRLKNYKDPKEVMDAYGADALRWMMLASPVMRGADLAVDPDGKFIRDVVRLNIKPLWSAYNFFTLYANADGARAKQVTASENMLDRYILAKTKAMVQQVEASLDAYDTPGATEAVTALLDVLNNWYIRRTRERFWAEAISADKQAAYDALYTVLNLVCLAAAPLLPFTAEAVYRGLNGADESVHLADFPDVSGIADEKELIADMDRVQDVCNAALSVRNKQNIRVRQPLASIRIVTDTDIAKRWHQRYGDFMKSIIKDEVNVKEIVGGETALESFATRKLTINSAALGKRLPTKMKEILPLSKKGDWKIDGNDIFIAGEKLLPEEYQLTLDPVKEFVTRAQALSTNDALVLLDLTITPELEAEGRARDLVRMIQQARKDAGLNVADRIALAVDVPAEFQPVLIQHGDYIKEQTLAVSLAEGSAAATQKLKQELDGAEFIIGISRAA